MKPKLRSPRRGDVSLVDLLAIIAAVAIVAVVFVLPMVEKPQPRSKAINCVNNLKQVGLAFRMWSQDNGDKLPAEVSTEGGAQGFVSAGNTFRQFLVMSNELSTPKILLCPDDKARKAATNFSSLSEKSVSYFVVPEANVDNASIWLTGDRNLAASRHPLGPGLHWLPTNQVVGWTEDIHVNKGNICFADGSVQQFSNAKLRESVANALQAFQATNVGIANFRLLIP